MPRPRTVYRGQRKYSWIITLAVFLLVLLVILAVWLFYDLQRYVVYDKEGVRLVLPSQQTDALPLDAPGDTAGGGQSVQPVEVQLVVEAADYSDLETGAGQGLAVIHARYLAAADVNERTMDFEHRGLGDSDALVTELMAPDGFLRWRSSLPLADSYAVNGTLDLSGAIERLRAGNESAWLVARISALEDAAMATRNTPAALVSAADGYVYQEGETAWLDPYSDVTRSYLTALLRELREIGCDEVLLGGFTCPEGERVAFSQKMTRRPDARDALVSLGLYLREQADALGLRLSVVLEPAALAADAEAPMGQDAALLLRIFDRVYYDAGAVGDAGAEALRALAGADAQARVVPIAAEAPEAGSFALR